MFLKLSAGSSRISRYGRNLCKKDDLLINNYNYNYFFFIRNFNEEEHSDIKKKKKRKWTALTKNLANEKNDLADKPCASQLQKHSFFVRPDETVLIGHFRVSETLAFKTRLSAKPLL